MFLEIIGITLAYIEIRYKPLANKIEMKIASEESRIKNFAYMLIENKLFSAIASIFITVVFFIEVPYMAGFYDRIIPKDWNGVKIIVIWSTIPVIVAFLGGICIILLGDFVLWLNHFSDGHAIGALGVVVTFLGLIGDTYQVITILFGS